MKKSKRPKYESPKIYWFERGGNCRAKPCFTHCGSPQVHKGIRKQLKQSINKV